MLRVTNVSKSFGGVAAVDRASFDVEERKITALIGPNGAGKTTLFNLISGTIPADAGSVAIAGEEVARLPVELRARRGLSRTFQLSRPFRNLTVRDHLLLARFDDDDEFTRLFAGRRGAVEDAALLEGLRRVGLDVSLDALAAALSYGQAKLLGIAVALAHPHTILLLDEPVAGVNPVVREGIAVLLRELREQGETVFLIEHDMQFVMPLADIVIVMDRGRVIAAGTPDAVQKNSKVLEAYLGEQL